MKVQGNDGRIQPVEAALYINETQDVSAVLQSVRDELTSAIRTAVLEKAYDTDVQLSFGLISIVIRDSIPSIPDEW